jgi:outer membrane receptor protein involved in Fe transport
MNAKLRYLAVFVTCVFVLVSSVPSLGQVIKGSISGSVVDPQGAVVAGAQVKARNIETGVVLATTSDSSGNFRFNLIPVGTYTVDVSASGFKTASQTSIAVVAGKDSAVGAIRMSLGETSTTVEVTSAAPLIETSQAQVTNTFSGVTLQTFAGVQENQGLDNLAQFVPGVNASRSNNFSNQNGPGFTVDGLRGRNNDQEIDGQNNNDNSVGGPGLFLSNPEFVQQYVLVTNNFGPEYGRNAGSVVNIITKSGGNAWHGSAFGTENSNYLNAMTNTQKRFSFKPDGVTPLSGPPRLNDEFTGGTIGGPLVKNKIFVFGGADDEILSQSSIFNSNALTPTPSGLTALATCFPTGVGAQAVAALTAFGPYSIKAGNPTPIGPTANAVTACPAATFQGVSRILSSPVHEYDFVVKNDIQLASDSITARFLYNKNTTFNRADSGTANAAAGYTDDVPALSQIFLTSWSHNFSSRMVNEARISFGRLNVEFGGNAFGSVATAQNLRNAVTNVAFTSGTLMGYGPATNIPQARIVNTWQAQDNWNYVWGKHSFKSGVNWTYQRSPNIFLPTFNGQYRFSSWNSYFANTPTSVSIADGTPTLDFREYDTFIYGGDDWKLTSNLTVNLGLTWSYYGQPANLFNGITVPRESNPATAFWSPTEPTGGTQVGGPFLNPGAAIPLGVRTFPIFPAPKNSFGPSIGFAYSPQWGGFLTGNGKTVFRGGYRMSYDPPYYNIYINMATSTPEVISQTFTGSTAAGLALPASPTGPNVRTQLGAALQKGVFDPRTFTQTSMQSDFGPDRVQSWSFGFERSLNKASALEVRYVGNHGDNLFQSVNANPFIGALATAFPNLIPAGVSPCPASQAFAPVAVGRINCNEGVLRSRNNTGYSDYHAIQTEFRANNLFKQLTMRAGYTFSKTTDNVSEIFNTGTAGNTVAFAQNPLDVTTGEHGISGLSFPNRFTMTLTEQLPFYREQHGLVGRLLGGWAFSTGYIYATGQPFTPEQIQEATNTAGNLYDNSFNLAFIGGETARPFLGNPSAPVNTVGIFCGDFKSAATCGASGIAVNQLVSVNSFNTSKTLVPVTQAQVHFIENTKLAQQLFGTPFGNVGRNPVTDAPANVVNMSIFKNFKVSERVSGEIHLTALNAFNHFNFASVDPVLLDAGLAKNGLGFADPSVTTTNAITDGFRKVYVGAKITF